MRHHRRGRKLGRSAAHRKALMMNLAASLIQHGRITTTESKAKELRPYIERLVTTARRDDVHARRVVRRKLRLNDAASARAAGESPVLRKLFTEIAPRFSDRPGGYTRIVKAGFRKHDAAPMAIIEWVDFVPEARPVHDHAHAHAHTHDHEHAHAAG